MQIKLFADAYAVCQTNLDARGISLEIVDEYEAIQDILLAVGKPYLTPHLSPLENSFTDENSFWVVAQKGNEVLCTGGVRFDDIGSKKLSAFWEKEANRYYSTEPNEHCLSVNPIVDELIAGGRICYMGDLISIPGRQSPRDLQNFARAIQMLACLKWLPDANCAFLKEHHVSWNAGVFYGFLSTGLKIFEWIDPPQPRDNDEHFMYSTSAELKLLASQIIQQSKGRNSSAPSLHRLAP